MKLLQLQSIILSIFNKYKNLQIRNQTIQMRKTYIFLSFPIVEIKFGYLFIFPFSKSVFSVCQVNWMFSIQERKGWKTKEIILKKKNIFVWGNDQTNTWLRILFLLDMQLVGFLAE